MNYVYGNIVYKLKSAHKNTHILDIQVSPKSLMNTDTIIPNEIFSKKT